MGARSFSEWIGSLPEKSGDLAYRAGPTTFATSVQLMYLIQNLQKKSHYMRNCAANPDLKRFAKEASK